MALTATASLEVREDIKLQLNIPDCIVLTSSFNRRNLTYEVRKKTRNVIELMASEILSKHRDASGVIYCLSQKDCETVASELFDRYGIRATSYHAGLNDKVCRGESSCTALPFTETSRFSMDTRTGSNRKAGGLAIGRNQSYLRYHCIRNGDRQAGRPICFPSFNVEERRRVCILLLGIREFDSDGMG